MNTEPPNGRFESDDSVDRAWRRTSIEEPPARVDASILAAAQAEAANARQAARPGSAERARRNGDAWPRWQPLAAAAAVAGLAFVLVQTIPRERDVAPPLSLERASPQAPTARPVESTERPSIAQEEAGADRSGGTAAASDSNLPVTPETQSLPPIERESPAPVAPPPPAPDATLAAPVEPHSELPAAAVQAPAAGTDRSEAFEDRARSSAKVAAESVEVRGPQPVPAAERWAEKIEALVTAGDYDAAVRELRAFRSTYGREEADRELPKALRAWAASVE